MSREEPMTEVIAGARGRAEPEVLAEFLARPYVSRWVGADAARRRRVEEEFHQAWVERWGDGLGQGPVAPGGGGRHRQATSRTATGGGPAFSRRELYLCTVCRRMAIQSEWDGTTTRVACGACGATFEDLLELIPVTPVSPFVYFFGPGLLGLVRVAGIAVAALGLYLILNNA